VCIYFSSPGHELATENLIAAQFVFHTASFSLDTELQLQQTTKELQYKLASKQICKFSIFV
jgi:hypothetical protein